MYKNEVSNSRAIQKELNRFFGQVNFVPGNLGNGSSYIMESCSFYKSRKPYTHWDHSIRRKSVVGVLFKTALKLRNRLFERPFWGELR